MFVIIIYYYFLMIKNVITLAEFFNQIKGSLPAKVRDLSIDHSLLNRNMTTKNRDEIVNQILQMVAFQISIDCRPELLHREFDSNSTRVAEQCN